MKDIYDIEDDLLFVKEIEQKYAVDLRQRLLKFAKDVILFLFLLPDIKQLDVFRLQLSKSGTSIGANYEESQAGTYKEFTSRIQICLREARETNYFLKVLKALQLEEMDLNIIDKNKYTSELIRLIQESEEIKKIFGAISSKIHKRTK